MLYPVYIKIGSANLDVASVKTLRSHWISEKNIIEIEYKYKNI